MGREIRRVPRDWEHPVYDEETAQNVRQVGEPIPLLRPDYGRPADAYQVYETVSEGTPVTPVFETAEALVDYLVEHGDFWHQDDVARGSRRRRPTREQAEAFVREGSVPLLIVEVGPGGNRLHPDYEAAKIT